MIRQNSIYVVGSTFSMQSLDRDVFLLRFDLSGKLVWSRTWDGEGSNGRPSIDEAKQVTARDGGIYVVGTTTSDAPSLNKQYANLMKYDTDGNLIWQRSIGPDDIYVYGYCSADCEDGEYIYGRFTDLRNPASRVDDLILYKLDGEWNPTSNKTLGWPRERELPVSILVSGGSIVVSGNTMINGKVTPFLIGCGQGGATGWNNTWVNPSGTAAMTYGKIIEVNSDIYMIGMASRANSTGTDALLLKYDRNGVFLDSWIWGQGGENGYDLCTSDGAIYMLGSTSRGEPKGSNIFLMKVNAPGSSPSPIESITVTP